MLRSVLISPNLRQMTDINKIRRCYDNLYQHIAPHISLVFPFDNDSAVFTTIVLDEN